MKSMMKGFYNPTDKELGSAWNSAQTLFVFDTNTFLNLYGYAEQTRSDFFSIINKIKDRVWIPYHVALEYQRRRLGVIKDEKHIFSKIGDNLNKISQVFSKDFNDLHLDKRIPALAASTDQLKSEITKLIEQYKKDVEKLDKHQPNVNGSDSIRNKLDSFFEKKVGSKPENQKWLDNVYNEGKDRFAKKYPPGYKDASKKQGDDAEFLYAGLRYERQYGDLILWKQMIQKASGEDIHSVVFVTDDSKEDWWQIEESRGMKTIGPRPELVEEIRGESNIDIFVMYKTADFLAAAGKNLNLDIDKNSIVEAKNIHEATKASSVYANLASSAINTVWADLVKAQAKYQSQVNLLSGVEATLSNEYLKASGAMKNKWLVGDLYRNEKLAEMIRNENSAAEMQSATKFISEIYKNEKLAEEIHRNERLVAEINRHENMLEEYQIEQKLVDKLRKENDLLSKYSQDEKDKE